MVFNSRSLRNKTYGVCEFLRENDCDACFITEAWIKVKDESVIAEIIDMGYEIKFQPRKGSRRGGGVCVLFKPDLAVNKCTARSFRTFEVLQTTITSANSLIRVSTFYHTGHISHNQQCLSVSSSHGTFLLVWTETSFHKIIPRRESSEQK